MTENLKRGALVCLGSIVTSGISIDYELATREPLCHFGAQHLGKAGNAHILRDQFVHDRRFAEYMTVWAEVWKEEDPSYDFTAEMENLGKAVNLLQGALTGFQRFAHTDEVLIDRSEV